MSAEIFLATRDRIVLTKARRSRCMGLLKPLVVCWWFAGGFLGVDIRVQTPVLAFCSAWRRLDVEAQRCSPSDPRSPSIIGRGPRRGAQEQEEQTKQYRPDRLVFYPCRAASGVRSVGKRTRPTCNRRNGTFCEKITPRHALRQTLCCENHMLRETCSQKYAHNEKGNNDEAKSAASWQRENAI
jgi:hypothetical protein